MNRYAKGARFERNVKKELEKEGWFVVRSAGSKGPADLIALKKHQIPVLLQLKSKYPSTMAAYQFIEWAAGLGGDGLIVTPDMFIAADKLACSDKREVKNE